MRAAIIAEQQNAGRAGHVGERMLIHVHRKWAPAGITAGGIGPYRSRARRQPDLERIDENPVRIVRINSDSLVVPVLGIVALATSAVPEGAALRTFHVSPARATICGSPCTKLATVGTAATGVAIPNDGLRLCVDVICVTRRDCDVDASELVGTAITGSGPTNNWIVARCAAAGIHGRTRRVRAAGHLITEDEPVGITGD
ncbi:MAG: hypothetical protein DME76_08375 [Verrucomicrobia bacterium]|nr:MAG: hypothetical protein DME76_08375 [Verrucomicrobiota bacterium]